MKQLLILVIVIGIAYGYRPYAYVVNGSKTEAAGRVTSVGLLSGEVIFNNPAFLPEVDNVLIYEFVSELGFRGFTTDYRFSFDIGSLGYVFSSQNKQSKETDKNNQVPRSAISYSTLFRSTALANLRQFNVPELSIRKLAFSQGFFLKGKIYLGYNVGLAIAIDSSLGLVDSVFALFPAAQLGVIFVLHKNILLGFTISSPLYLDWELWSGYELAEWTPFSFSIGSQINLSPYVTLLAEINYQGWDMASYQFKGRERYIDKGSSFFDFNQNVFVNLGLYIHGRNRLKEKLPQDIQQMETYQLKEDILEIDRDLQSLEKVLERANPLEDLKEKSKKQIKQIQLYKQKTETLNNSGRLSVKQSKRLSLIKKEIWEKEKFLEEKIKEKNNISVIFGAQRQEKILTQEIEKLQSEIDILEKEITSISLSHLTPQQRTDLIDSHKKLKRLIQSHRELVTKIATTEKLQKRKKNSYVNKIIQKTNSGKFLSKEEEKIYHLEIKKDALLSMRKSKVKRLKKMLSANRSLIKGEFYLGYASEVIYRRSGQFYPSGNFTFGFSFRPVNVKNLYFTFSLTDKTILRWINLYPQNEPTEIIKITTSHYF